MKPPTGRPPVVVYVETNFLLELAYQQEEFAACERLVQAASDGQIRLYIPVFSIVEARVAWRRQTKQRAELLTTLRRELRELTRSRPHAELTAKSTDLVAALVGAGEEDRRRLEVAISAVEGFGTVLPGDRRRVRAVPVQAPVELRGRRGLRHERRALRVGRLRVPGGAAHPDFETSGTHTFP